MSFLEKSAFSGHERDEHLGRRQRSVPADELERAGVGRIVEAHRLVGHQGDVPQPGGEGRGQGRPEPLLVDHLLAQADGGAIEAEAVLGTLLRALGPVWPGRLRLDGVPLGDCWHHPALGDGLLPFHKLTQWLTYSLLEPLEAAGLLVRGLERLTGLPEYRNGGLLLDCGVIRPRDTRRVETPATACVDAGDLPRARRAG